MKNADDVQSLPPKVGIPQAAKKICISSQRLFPQKKTNSHCFEMKGIFPCCGSNQHIKH